MQYYEENPFDTDDVRAPTQVQWQEFDPANGNTRKCGLCFQVKKVSDFPMSFSTRKSPNCRVCVLIKKRGLKCMPTDATTESADTVSNEDDYQNEDTVSEGSGSATFEAASAPFSIGDTTSNQSTPRTMAKKFRKRLSWTSSTGTSSSDAKTAPFAPMMC
ncbi:expressed unknown protein [Seminavis robusta]|uniref:Uncharacterized protein n=1 Tax=Seminavis robusta TaxID=568900 RepID=A0A9N8D7M7_9STRA|nr:expressed unknown protein [Seminavis robusta]|eukprot:Sro26_g017860.1 n/a (160) ;mRNA; f:141467-141946